MTPTEKWIFCLALVYAIPSFFSGVGITLLVVRWQDIRRAAAMMPRFLSPGLAPGLPAKPRDTKTVNLAPTDKSQGFA